MVSTTSKPAITGVKISTVVPGKVRGENEDHVLTNTDLAVKLHYIRGIYFFKNVDPDHHLMIDEIKKPMFELLDRFFVVAGRIRRRSDDDKEDNGGGIRNGRPYVKCNDAGVRIVEALCEKSIDEWLLGLDDDDHQGNCHGGLCYDQVLGPDLGFSPLVYLQFTRFKCGGLSVGLSWAHVIGDVLSAVLFINTWAQIISGHVPQESIHVPSYPTKIEKDSTRLAPKKTLPLKEVDSVANHWLLTANNGQNMRTHSFKVTPKQLELLISDNYGKKKPGNFLGWFEILSAVIWKTLSRKRQNARSQIVTICSYDYSCGNNNINNKSMVLSTVEADMEAEDVLGLAFRIANERRAENDAIEEVVGKRIGSKVDFFVYGANLTFVNLEDAKIYGLKLEGQRPVFANYTIAGVGDEGLVLVLPIGTPNEGRNVSVVLPEDELFHLKNELNQKWNIS